MKPSFHFLLLGILAMSSAQTWSQTQTTTEGHLLKVALIQTSREIHEEHEPSYWGTSTMSIEQVGYDIAQPILGDDNLKQVLRYYNLEYWIIRGTYAIPRQVVQQIPITLPGFPADNILFNHEYPPSTKMHEHIFPLTPRTYAGVFFRETSGILVYNNPDYAFVQIEP